MKPKTRFENFLAKIAKDEDTKEIMPRTRVEHYLNEIALNGSGGTADLGYTVDTQIVKVCEEQTVTLDESSEAELTVSISEDDLETIVNDTAIGTKMYVTIDGEEHVFPQPEIFYSSGIRAIGGEVAEGVYVNVRPQVNDESDPPVLDHYAVFFYKVDGEQGDSVTVSVKVEHTQLTFVSDGFRKAVWNAALSQYDSWSVRYGSRRPGKYYQENWIRRFLENIGFAEFEHTGVDNVEVYVYFHDGSLQVSVSIENDPETGDLHIMFGDWLYNPEGMTPAGFYSQDYLDMWELQLSEYLENNGLVGPHGSTVFRDNIMPAIIFEDGWSVPADAGE